jgi:hypothetical protein
MASLLSGRYLFGIDDLDWRTYTKIEVKQFYSKVTFQTNFKIIYKTQIIFTDLDELDDLDY